MERGSFMAEGSELSIPKYTPEQAQKAVRPHLVTGAHNTDLGTARVISNRIDSGDLRANAWEATDVSKRLRSSFPQPSVLALDGLRPLQLKKPNERDYDFDQKKSIWKIMPGRPQGVNASGEVFLVAGDIVDYSYQEVLQPFYAQKAVTPDGRKSALNEINKERLDLYSASSTTLPDMYAALPTVAIALAAITSAVNYGDKRIEKRNPSRNAKMYSRRKFLELGAVAGGAAATGFLINRFLPKQTVPVKMGDDLVDTILRIIKREDSNTASVDGRTALMIEKGILGAQYLDKSDVTVVAGDAHSHKGDDFLANPGARAAAVSEYTKILLKIVNEASDKAGFSNDLRLSAKGILLDNILYGQIIRAVDPGYIQVAPNEVSTTLDKSIQFQSDFMLGNSAVANAVEEFRQGAPKVYGPFGMKID